MLERGAESQGDVAGAQRELLETISHYLTERDGKLEELQQELAAAATLQLAQYEELRAQLAGKEQTHREMEQFMSLLNATLESSRDGVLLQDEDGEAIIFNPTAAHLLQTTPDVLGSASLGDLIDVICRSLVNQDEVRPQLLEVCADSGRNLSCVLEYESGEIVDCHTHPRCESNRVVGRVWSFRDITELVMSERDARHRAFHDPLTGLPNRTLFSDRLEHALLSRKRREEANHHTLFFIDLDGFKYVNDTLGHAVGDRLLQEVAARLRDSVREGDTIARHGGDEFLVLLEGTRDIREISAIANRVLSQLKRPFTESGQDIYISASIGITIGPEDGDEPSLLIRNADMAMYEAKRSGRNNFQFFLPEMMEHSRRQLNLHNNLSRAIRKREFSLFYQPKISLADGSIVSAEALIRWQQGERFIPPVEFIAAAEVSGLIVPISEWVLDTACRQLQAWSEGELAKLSLSINISAYHFRMDGFVDAFVNAVNRYGIEPSRLEIEITESALMHNLAEGIQKLRTLRELGLRVSIDDFGTGYSSFSYLKTLPVNAIKIDRSFVRDLLDSPKDAALVSSMISIAHTLDLEVVAEGVETGEMAALLAQQQCDLVQGYFYSRPVAAAEFEAFCRSFAPELPEARPHSDPVAL